MSWAEHDCSEEIERACEQVVKQAQAEVDRYEREIEGWRRRCKDLEETVSRLRSQNVRTRPDSELIFDAAVRMYAAVPKAHRQPMSEYVADARAMLSEVRLAVHREGGV